MTTEAPAPAPRKPAPPKVGDPHMSPEERALFDRVFDGGIGHYLEFGMGGSTLLALRRGAKSIVAVDSDEKWVAALRTHAEIEPEVEKGRVRLLHGDIGETKEWGQPVTRQKSVQWPNYLLAPWREVRRRGVLPDTVFVDGRFRLACCLTVALSAREARGGQGPVIMMHDVSEKRPVYLRAEEVLEVVNQAGSLREYRIRQDVPPMIAMTMLLHYQFVPD